jgi:hypothetical protein
MRHRQWQGAPAMVPAVVMAWMLTLPLSALVSRLAVFFIFPSSEICYQPKN